MNFKNLVETIEMFFIPNGHDSVKGFSHKVLEISDPSSEHNFENQMTCFLKTKTDGDYELEITQNTDEDGHFLYVVLKKIIDGDAYGLFSANYITSITELIVIVNFCTRIYVK